MRKLKSKKSKKFKIILFLLTICFLVFSNVSYMVFANTDEQTQLEQNLNNTLHEQLNNLDFSGLEELLEDLNLEEYSVFKSVSFKDKVASIISGNFKEGYGSVFEALVNLLFGGIANFVPLFATLVAIGVLSSFVSNLSPNSKNKSITDIVHFVCYGLIIIITFSCVVQVVSLTGQTLGSIKKQVDYIFPILLTIMTALGAVTSVSVYQPAVAIFSGGIIQLFYSVVIPIFIFTLVFNVVGNLSSSVQLKKLNQFFSSSFKWMVGSVFTIFMGFLSIQGITAGSYDKVSIRTAKFAMRSYIPIVGGYLSEGFNVIMASGVLIKNAVGLAGLMLMFATILMPVIQLVVLKFGLNLTAAILEPVADKRISDFIMSVSKTLIMLIVSILAVAFLYFIMVALIICTGNIV